MSRDTVTSLQDNDETFCLWQHANTMMPSSDYYICKCHIATPLPTSLIALYIFSLFCLIMLGQRYTTPMVTVVCPLTSLHHMASLQSASSCSCTSYAGIVSLVYYNTPT